MHELAAHVGPWPLVVACVLLAVVMPLSASRLLTPAVLREASVLLRPGRVVAGAVVALILLGLHGAVAALLAVAHPFLWAIEAPILRGVAVVIGGMICAGGAG